MDLANHSQAVGAGRFRPQLDGLGAAGLGHWAKNPGGALFGAQNDAPGTLKRRICSVLALGHFQVCLSLSLSRDVSAGIGPLFCGEDCSWFAFMMRFCRLAQLRHACCST